MTILDGRRGQRRKRGCARIGSASDRSWHPVSEGFFGLIGSFHMAKKCMQERAGEESYGPISEGVTGSEGGGGKLIKVGVVIVASFIRACLYGVLVLKYGRRLIQLKEGSPWDYQMAKQGSRAKIQGYEDR